MANHKTRLELTWIGKENRPKLEPRILVDYVLRVKVTRESQPVAVALAEAKAEHLRCFGDPAYGYDMAQGMEEEERIAG